MDPAAWQVIGVVLASFVGGGFIGALINGRNDARKIRLAELQELDEAWATWRAEMLTSHDRCQVENAELRARIVELEDKLRALQQEVTDTRHAVGEAIENAAPGTGVRRPPSLRTRATD